LSLIFGNEPKMLLASTDNNSWFSTFKLLYEKIVEDPFGRLDYEIVYSNAFLRDRMNSRIGMDDNIITKRGMIITKASSE
jgi:hypothetical protein